MNQIPLVVWCIAAAPGVTEPVLAPLTFLVLASVLTIVGVVAAGGQGRHVKADKHLDDEGNARAFALRLGEEKVTLEPGKPWIHVDRHKWVTRGLIEPPQSFHVLRDGTVEINGEKIRLDDPEGSAKLEHEINKHHAPAGVFRSASATPTAPVAAAPAPVASSGKVHFKLKLDHLGRVMIECLRGAERLETSLRGLSTLIHNGLMLKPGSMHLDPLLRFVEIDGVRFESNESGARQLEETLNGKYAPVLKAGHESAIEIKDNPASPTGFDIHFVTVRVGARFDVKGHLTQEQLDVLQDPAKCDLLQPGTVLRLSPPHLLARKKRPDGGEERIAGIPDVHYLRVNALELEQFFNHPLIRQRGATAEEVLHSAELRPEEILELRVIRHPKDRMLWVECETIQGGKFEWRALSHHNVVDLQQSAVFLPHLEISLSLDHRTLRILNTRTNQEQTILIDHQSSDEDLAKAGQMLTAALKPAKPRPIAPQATPKPEPQPAETGLSEEQGVAAFAPPPDSPQVAPSAFPRPSPRPAESPALTPAGQAIEPGTAELAAPPATEGTSTTAQPARSTLVPRDSLPKAIEGTGPSGRSESLLDSRTRALFSESDPLRINTEIFRRLTTRCGVGIQDVRLSLPRIFTDRRFEIINFNEQEVESVLELRGEEYYGFYVSHISERRIDFVYACCGTKIEWGTDKCVLQPAATAEPVEFKGSALLGLAQTQDNQFVFVVTPEYHQWVRPHESACREVFAHFRTVEHLAAAPEEYTFIWPERPTPEGETGHV